MSPATDHPPTVNVVENEINRQTNSPRNRLVIECLTTSQRVLSQFR
jgi:hypothetical protein